MVTYPPRIITVTSLAALMALATITFETGQVVHVQTLKAWFVYDATSGETIDGITVTSTSNPQFANSRFIRLPIAHPHWATVATWFVNAGTGNDENDGTSSGAPLRTQAEVARRTGTTQAFVAGGDLSGSNSTQTVIAIRGSAVDSTPGASGQVLTAIDGTHSHWADLPTPTPPFTAAGDLAGSNSSQVVIGIRGAAVANTPPTAGQVLTATSSSAVHWATPADPTTPFSAGGDLAGTSSSQTVAAVRGSIVDITPATSGQVLTAIDATHSHWATPATPPTFTVAGDLSGNTSSQTVVAIRGASVSATPPTAGQVLTATGPSSAQWATPSTTPAFTAAGDLSGNTSSQTVIAIRGAAVSATPPSAGQVLTATSPGVLQWATPAATTPPFTAAGDLEGSYASQTVIAIRGVAAGVTPPTTGQVLMATGPSAAHWADLPSPGSTFTAGGDLSGTSSSQTVVALRGAALDVTPPTAGQVLTATGSSAAHWATPASSFTAGGDLSGSPTSQVVIAIRGAAVSSTPPTTGQVLTATGPGAAQWATPSVFTAGGDLSGSTSSQTVIAIRGASVSATPPSAGQVLTATGPGAAQWATPATPPTFTAAGDLSGSNSSQTVIAIRGAAVSATPPTTGQVLTATGPSAAQWTTPAPAFSAAGDLSGSNSSQSVVAIRGAAVSATPPVAGQVLTATGTAAAQWSTPAAAFVAGGDLSGTVTSQTVAKVRGVAIGATPPTAGQVLTATGTAAAQWNDPYSLAYASGYTSTLALAADRDTDLNYSFTMINQRSEGIGVDGDGNYVVTRTGIYNITVLLGLYAVNPTTGGNLDAVSLAIIDSINSSTALNDILTQLVFGGFVPGTTVVNMSAQAIIPLTAGDVLDFYYRDFAVGPGPAQGETVGLRVLINQVR